MKPPSAGSLRTAASASWRSSLQIGSRAARRCAVRDLEAICLSSSMPYLTHPPGAFADVSADRRSDQFLAPPSAMSRTRGKQVMRCTAQVNAATDQDDGRAAASPRNRRCSSALGCELRFDLRRQSLQDLLEFVGADGDTLVGQIL